MGWWEWLTGALIYLQSALTSDLTSPFPLVFSFCRCFGIPSPHWRDGYFMLSWPAKGQEKSHHDWADFASLFFSSLAQRNIAPGAVDIKSEHILLTVAECLGGWSRLRIAIFRNKLMGTLLFIKKGNCILHWIQAHRRWFTMAAPRDHIFKCMENETFHFHRIEQEGRQVPGHFAPWKPKPGPERIVLFVQRPGIRSEIYALKRPISWLSSADQKLVLA